MTFQTVELQIKALLAADAYDLAGTFGGEPLRLARAARILQSLFEFGLESLGMRKAISRRQPEFSTTSTAGKRVRAWNSSALKAKMRKVAHRVRVRPARLEGCIARRTRIA